MSRYAQSTALNGVVIARGYEDALTNSTSNTYVGVGQISTAWGKPVVSETVDSLSDLFNNLAAIKKINSSDINLVVSDRVWAANTAYDQFDSNQEMYSHEAATLLTGTVSYSSQAINLTGTSSLFAQELANGDIIQLSGSGTETDYIRKEVVRVISNTNLNVNTIISITSGGSTTYPSYTDNLAYKIENVYPAYGKAFYVRNSYDQVFICLYNNSGATSTIEPVLRPENFSMNKMVQSTTDGYIWRYLYTIPSGLKAKFLFTDTQGNSWMPVATDDIVSATAVDGAIEHIRVLNGGDGYNSNTACSNVDIVVITGDGSGASYVANVNVSISDSTTTIAELISANNGVGYSYANVTVSDATGTGASLSALIGPPGGFGKDPAKDLGAKFLAISVELDSDVGGSLPVSTTAGDTVFRQVSLLQNPQYSNGDYVSVDSVATSANLKVDVSSTPTTGTLVQQLGGYSGTVVGFTNPYLLLNNTRGTFANTAVFTSGIVGNGQTLTAPLLKRSGSVLYVENIAPVTRDTNQAEQIKFVFKF